ncbi:Adenosine deaminase [Araneus ventricosus]|uniref:adenosine deaminase n=1 Tax=Araneus ventricosus TaxID=182803 RepID=A0A4Y2H0Q3_ARAVE|nr:Adenosine deaminase [Araneus ventricosus]
MIGYSTGLNIYRTFGQPDRYWYMGKAGAVLECLCSPRKSEKACVGDWSAWKKGIHLKVDTLEDLYEASSVKFPTTLADFLEHFTIFHPVFVGDAEAIERVAYEFCQDSAKQNVLYSEVRYCPHTWTSAQSPLTPRDVVKCVNRGLSRGSDDFKIMVRSILCCSRANPGEQRKS